MIYSRLNAGKQFVFFATPLNFPRVIKSKRMFKILIVAAQAERRFLDHRLPQVRNMVIQFPPLPSEMEMAH